MKIKKAIKKNLPNILHGVGTVLIAGSTIVNGSYHNPTNPINLALAYPIGKEAITRSELQDFMYLGFLNNYRFKRVVTIGLLASTIWAYATGNNDMGNGLAMMTTGFTASATGSYLQAKECKSLEERAYR